MDDSELPARAVDYTNGGARARVGFLCASTSQQDCATAALRKALEWCAVENNLFTLDNKQRESILKPKNSVQCHFEQLNLKNTGGFVNLLLGVDLAGIVKDNQHLDVLLGEGPHKVIFSVEAAEAFKEIQIVTPGSDSKHDNAKRSVKDGVDNGKKKYSGKAAKDRAWKRNMGIKSKRL